MYPSRNIRKRGLTIDDRRTIITSQQEDGGWIAWIEEDGSPLELKPNRPRVFYGSTRFQAQCAAAKWLASQPTATQPTAKKPPPFRKRPSIHA